MTTITISRATVEQALEALENLQPIIGNGLLDKRQLAFIDPHLDIAITALRAALAQQAEPVALTHRHEWFRTGGMEQGQFRCIHCGVWAKETAHD